MTDIALTIKQLETLFQTLTMTMLGLPVTDASAYNVRIAWPTGGSPAWKITDDICSIRVFEIDDQYNRQRDTELSNVPATTDINLMTHYTCVNSVTFVLYGPNSYNNAQAIRDQMFYPATRMTLAQSNIYLIPDAAAPKRLTEKFEGQWWERTDLTITFNELVVKNLTISSIKTAPVIVVNEIGQEFTNNIE